MVFVQPDSPVFLALERQNWQVGIRVARGFCFFRHMYYLDKSIVYRANIIHDCLQKLTALIFGLKIIQYLSDVLRWAPQLQFDFLNHF